MSMLPLTLIFIATIRRAAGDQYDSRYSNAIKQDVVSSTTHAQSQRSNDIQSTTTGANCGFLQSERYRDIRIAIDVRVLRSVSATWRACTTKANSTAPEQRKYSRTLDQEKQGGFQYRGQSLERSSNWVMFGFGLTVLEPRLKKLCPFWICGTSGETDLGF